MSEAPKSALEIVMERLKKKDAEAGIEETPLTDEQRAQIADVRSLYEARAAERRIMHESEVTRLLDPAELQVRQDALRRDLAQLESDRDAKIARIRNQK